MSKKLDESIILGTGRRTRQNALLLAPAAALLHLVGAMAATTAAGFTFHQLAVVVWTVVFCGALLGGYANSPGLRRLIDDPEGVAAIVVRRRGLFDVFRVTFDDGDEVTLRGRGTESVKLAMALGRHCRLAAIQTPWVRRPGLGRATAATAAAAGR